MATISEMKKEGRTVGIWASCDKGQVGVVAQDGVGAYLCLYGEKAPFPNLAICLNREGKACLQLPGPNGSATGYKQYAIDELCEALGIVAKIGEAFEIEAPEGV